jgi:hypothetical protein
VRGNVAGVGETAIGIALQASGTSPEDTFDTLDLAACGLAGDDTTGPVVSSCSDPG